MGERDGDRLWTGTFERLGEAKRARVLEAAKRAFAASGFAGANVNRIAEEADISVGSMYKYFRTKEDLFLSLIEGYNAIIASWIDGVFEREASFAGRVELLLKACVESSLADPEAVRLYIACTTEELSRMASKLSGSIEEVSASRYRAMIAEAQAKGEVEAGLDPGWAAFFLDDILLMTQYSVGSVYYRERLRLFLGLEGPSEREAETRPWPPEDLVPALLDLVLRALAPRRPEDGAPRG
jgi:AcrR family transcriptional regulator